MDQLTKTPTDTDIPGDRRLAERRVIEVAGYRHCGGRRGPGNDRRDASFAGSVQRLLQIGNLLSAAVAMNRPGSAAELADAWERQMTKVRREL